MLARPNARAFESQRNSGCARGRKGRAVWFGEESAGLGSEVKGKRWVVLGLDFVDMSICCFALLPQSHPVCGWSAKYPFFFGSCWPVRLQTLKCFFSKKRSVLIFQSQWRHKDSIYPLWPPLFTSQAVFAKLPTVITVTAVHIVMLWVVKNAIRRHLDGPRRVMYGEFSFTDTDDTDGLFLINFFFSTCKADFPFSITSPFPLNFNYAVFHNNHNVFLYFMVNHTNQCTVYFLF